MPSRVECTASNWVACRANYVRCEPILLLASEQWTPQLEATAMTWTNERSNESVRLYIAPTDEKSQRLYSIPATCVFIFVVSLQKKPFRYAQQILLYINSIILRYFCGGLELTNAPKICPCLLTYKVFSITIITHPYKPNLLYQNSFPNSLEKVEIKCLNATCLIYWMLSNSIINYSVIIS